MLAVVAIGIEVDIVIVEEVIVVVTIVVQWYIQ
jgi:hypothetical protein